MNPGDIVEIVCDDRLEHAYHFNGTKGIVVRQGSTRGGDAIPGITVVMVLGLTIRYWFYDKHLKVIA
jgi:hypothetical protein